MKNVIAEQVTEAEDSLGEGPIWDPASEAILWVDIEGRRIESYRLSDRRRSQTELHHRPGAIALREGGGLLIAAEHKFLEIDTLGAPPRVVATLEEAPADARLNDGVCDPQGRFWAGTMTEHLRPGASALYRLNPDYQIECVLSGVTLSNGLAWDPEGTTLYYIDSMSGGIDAFDYESETGSIKNRRRIIEIGSPFPLLADGMTIDSDGLLWVAVWGGGAVRRYRPDGRLDRIVRVPVSQPTSCCFGGPRLDELYITSARSGLTALQLAEEPLAGALFWCRPGAEGLPAAQFASSRK